MQRIEIYFALMFCVAPNLSAAIVGTNPPALPLSTERISSLPAKQQPVWKKYLEHSVKQLRADRAFFFNEVKSLGIKEFAEPPKGNSKDRLPLNKPASWYSEPEALRIADIIVSFQTPAGGWSKNLSFSEHRRAPGEPFATGGGSARLTEFDNDLPRDFSWSYVGTFDNSATTTQLRFLAKVIRVVNPKRGEVYRAAFFSGMNYIFAAQNPNGGWPQVWPLEGSYHDAITFNDGAMINVLQLLKNVAKGSDEFAFVPQSTRKFATSSLQRGIDCILATQILTGGRRTVWCQQHDLLTLQPTSARNYEMPSQGGSESAEIMWFLMELPDPNAKIVTAVHEAAAWLEKAEIHDFVFKRVGEDGRELVPTPGAEPLWARYYQIGTDRPIFGDRDKTIHSDVSEISKERRNGYSWFSAKPMRALDRYALWKEAHPNRSESNDGKLDESVRQSARR